MMAVTAWHGSHAHALDRMHDYFSVRLLAEVEGNWTIAHSTACCSIQIRSSTYSLSSCTPSRPFSHALIPALSAKPIASIARSVALGAPPQDKQTRGWGMLVYQI